MPSLNKNRNIIWKTVWMTIMRTIWERINNVLFRNAIIDGGKYLQALN